MKIVDNIWIQYKYPDYRSLLASRSDSRRVKMSPSRTGPLTFLMILRWSSMNSTRTCVHCPWDPVLPRTFVTRAKVTLSMLYPVFTTSDFGWMKGSNGQLVAVKKGRLFVCCQWSRKRKHVCRLLGRLTSRGRLRGRSVRMSDDIFITFCLPFAPTIPNFERRSDWPLVHGPVIESTGTPAKQQWQQQGMDPQPQSTLKKSE